MQPVLVGREIERKLLEKYIASGKSEFIAVYGRRRVGKTFFIRQVVGDDLVFSFSGMENASLDSQLECFWLALQKKVGDIPKPSSWLSAFDQLEQYLDNLSVGSKNVFIDELPWLDTARSQFVSALEHFWNNYASSRSDIKLIVCGSATSWMIDKLICNRGGLHNRVTHQIEISPFTLNEAEKYFETYGFGYRRKEIAECYMALGGIPFYYSLMNVGESVAQNIDRLVFSRTGELRLEFQNLYRSLFKKSSAHEAVIEALSKKKCGLTRKEILDATGLNNNKAFSVVLTELEQCGFTREYTPIGNTKRDVLIQLIDPFTLFHFYFESENKNQDENFWTNSLHSPQFKTWSGLAFEMLCLNHVLQIKNALGISGVQCRVCSWRSHKSSGKNAQIDLLLDRADQTVNVCEMKFSKTEYEISKSDADNFENKLESFISETKTKKSVMFTMVTSFGLKHNKYSGFVQKELTLDDLFVGNMKP